MKFMSIIHIIMILIMKKRFQRIVNSLFEIKEMLITLKEISKGSTEI